MKTDLPRWPRVAVAAAAVVGLGVGVAGTAVVVGLADGEQGPPGTQSYDGPISLVAYDTCESALRELKDAALPHVTEYGLGGEYFGIAVDGGVAVDGDRAVAADAEGSGGQAAAPNAAAPAPPGGREQGAAKEGEYSGTTVHESGVDEPDLVKTDGRRVVTVADGTVRVVDVATRAQTARVTLPEGHASQLLLDGDRALVMTTSGIPIDMPMPRTAPGSPTPAPKDGYAGGSQLVLVDLTGAGKVLGTLQVDGAYLDARQVGSVARVVVRATPRLEFGYPMRPGDEEDAKVRNRGVVENSTIVDWLPRYTLDNEGRTSEGRLVDCTSVSHPQRYTGTALLTVLTVDLTKQLTTGDPIAIAADGDTVYGTGENLYVVDDHFTHAASGFAPDERPMPAGSQRAEV